MPRDPYITLQEAASLLDVTPATLRNWDRSAKLKAVRHPVNRYRMYRLNDVLALQQQSSLFPVTEPIEEIAKGLSANKPLSATEIRRIVRALHRLLRDGEGNSSLIERFDELTKILFCKIHDEKGNNGKDGSPFTVEEGDTDATVADKVRKSFNAQVKHTPHLFPDRYARLNLKDRTIRQIVETLAPVVLSNVSEDLKGLAYEEVIRNTFEKGDNQQFFTPRNVVEFMVQMLGPALSGTICDPACGTGGFLLFAETYLRTRSKRVRAELLGFEIDDRLAWVAGINLDMHNAQAFRIEHLTGAGSLGKGAKPYFEQIDAILTNPPFGSDMTDVTALAALELGQGRQSRRRGVLFIERCLDLLKPGGVVGIIIDEGVLNAPTNADVRRLILERSDVLAVVSLPETTFMPYASVKASILFLQKKGGRKARLLKDGKTFFASAEVVGRKPNGEPLFRINRETGRQELDTDLPDVLKLWEQGDTGESSERGFWSAIPDVKDDVFSSDGLRLDLAYHHPSRHEAMRTLQGSPYPLKPLVELCDLRNEVVVPSRDLLDEDITYVGLANIEAHTGVCSPVVVSGVSLKSSVKRFVGNDIIFSKMRPELRKVCLVPHDVAEGFTSSECLVLVPKVDRKTGEPIMLRELLSLLLRSDLVYGQIVHLVIGIGRPRLSKSAVMNIRIPVPPVKDQRRLLELYQRSEAASRALIVESQQALQKSEDIMADARKRLLDDLLMNGEPTTKR
jgi:type I restriction-modification system DNA methylase subunit